MGGTIAVHWNSAAICSRAAALPNQEGNINKAGAAAAAAAAVAAAAAAEPPAAAAALWSREWDVSSADAKDAREGREAEKEERVMEKEMGRSWSDDMWREKRRVWRNQTKKKQIYIKYAPPPPHVNSKKTLLEDEM